jgi:hypothetical protein
MGVGLGVEVAVGLVVGVALAPDVGSVVGFAVEIADGFAVGLVVESAVGILLGVAIGDGVVSGVCAALGPLAERRSAKTTNKHDNTTNLLRTVTPKPGNHK